jgi:hypothetical protein
VFMMLNMGVLVECGNRSEVRIEAPTLCCRPAGIQGCQHMSYFLCSCDKLAAKLLIAK